jgi:hypothetical protein
MVMVFRRHGHVRPSRRQLGILRAEIFDKVGDVVLGQPEKRHAYTGKSRDEVGCFRISGCPNLGRIDDEMCQPVGIEPVGDAAQVRSDAVADSHRMAG